MRSINRFFHTITTSVVLFSLTLSAIQVPTTAVSAQGQDDGIVREFNSDTGKVTLLTGANDQPVAMLSAMSMDMTDQQRADVLVQSFAPEFGVTNPRADLEMMAQSQPAENRVTTKYQQTYKGVPVIAGELIVNASEQGALYSMNGEVAQALSLDTTPTLTADEAVASATQGMVKWYGGEAGDYKQTQAELWIFDENLLRPSIRPAELVWRVEMVPVDEAQPIRELVLVNAETGNVPLHFNQIDTSWHSADMPRQEGEPTVTPTPTEIPTEEPVVTETPVPTETPAPFETPIPTEEIQPTPTPETLPTEVPGEIDALAIATYYVNGTTGNDSNTCTTVASPCKHIQQAIEKGSTAGDTIYVASGTYTWSDSVLHPNFTNVVIIDRGITLSGSWNTDFSVQNGVSVIDGENKNIGIFANYGTTIVENFIVQNSYSGAGGDGGGIYVYSSNFTLKNSTLKNNVSDFKGAGIYSQNGTLTLINNTISGNGKSPATDYGGGIYINSGTATITNSTIAYNTAFYGGGGISRNTGTYTIKNTIIANNTAAANPDCNGAIGNSSYNIIKDITGCIVTTGTGDQFNIDPLIDNSLSGTMQTHALQSGSPAINAGTSTGCPATDENGIPRPQGSGCDIGAVEYYTTGSPTTVTALNWSTQMVKISTSPANPFIAIVKDENGLPMSGVEVIFSAPNSGASGAFSDTSTNTTTVTTDAGGWTTAPTFTTNTSVGNYVVEATVSGIASPVEFELQNYISTPTTISVNAGSPQSAMITQAFGTALSALIKDQAGKPVQGATVTFSAPASGASGKFSNTSTNTTTATTGSDGIATASTFTANNIIGTYFISASAAGTPSINFQLTNNSFPPTAIGYEDLVVDEARGKLYGSYKAGNKVDVIDMNTLTVVSQFSLVSGAAPTGLDLSPDGNELAVAQSGLSNVKFINLTDNSISELPATLSGTSTKAFDVVYGRIGVLYVLSSNGLHVINITASPHIEDTTQYVADNPITYDSNKTKSSAISSDKNTLYIVYGAYTSTLNLLSKYNISTELTKPTLLTSTSLYQTGYKYNLRVSLIDDNNLIVSSGSVHNTSGLRYKAKNAQMLSPVIALPGKSFYVTEYNNTSGNDTLFFHDNESSYKVSSLSTNVAGTPGAMAVTNDGSTLFASSTGGMTKFDIGSTAPGTAISLPTSTRQYNDMAIDTVRGLVYGTDPSGRVDVYNLGTTAQVNSYLLPSGASPKGIDLSPDGSELAIALNGLEKILFINPETGTEIAEVTPQTTIPNLPYDVIYGRAGRLYSDGNPVPNNDYLHIIDTATHTWVAKSAQTLQTGAELAITTDKNYIYTNEASSPNKMYVFDVQTDTISKKYEKNSSISATKFTIAPDGSKIFTSNGQAWNGTLAIQLGTFAANATSEALIKYIDNTQKLVASRVDFSSEDRIWLISASNYQLVYTMTFPGENIYEMEVSPDNEKLVINTNNGIKVIGISPSDPYSFVVFSGSNQSAHLQNQFTQPLVVNIKNFLNQNVAGASVTFAAPTSGSSGVFSDTGTNTTTSVTDANGNATSPAFIANNIEGSYAVTATVSGLSSSVSFQLTNGLQIKTYTVNHGTTLPGTFKCDLSMPACTNGADLHVDSAQKYAVGTYNFYLTQHNRYGIDGNDMPIISSVRYKSGYNNAFWDYTQMVYGDASDWPMADDVVAHELTHGVTQYESNLFYFYQSGAINESFSDLWGEYYDQVGNYDPASDTPAVKWLVSEDIKPGSTGAIRSMSNPPLFKDPDKMSSTYYVKTHYRKSHYEAGESGSIFQRWTSFLSCLSDC